MIFRAFQSEAVAGRGRGRRVSAKEEVRGEGKMTRRRLIGTQFWVSAKPEVYPVIGELINDSYSN